MLVRNIGAKIINIGSNVLMPDSTLTVSDAVAGLPAMKTFAEMGFIRLEEETTKKEEPTEAPKEEVKEEAKTTTRGRRAKTAE